MTTYLYMGGHFVSGASLHKECYCTAFSDSISVMVLHKSVNLHLPLHDNLIL